MPKKNFVAENPDTVAHRPSEPAHNHEGHDGVACVKHCCTTISALAAAACAMHCECHCGGDADGVCHASLGTVLDLLEQHVKHLRTCCTG